MKTKVLLLDYDLTLYPPTVKALEELDKRINLFMESFLGFSSQEAQRARIQLCKEYGTTLRGLQLLHSVDPHHYFDFIHQVSDHFIPMPDPDLNRWLRQSPFPLYLFTNGRRDWAERGLSAMGLATLPCPIREIFDIGFLGWVGKPNPCAYEKVERHLKEIHGPDLDIFFADDKPDNLLSAKARNWKTIWISPLIQGVDKDLDREPVQEQDGIFDFSLTSLIHLDMTLL